MESKFATLKNSVAMTILFSSHVAISMLLRTDDSMSRNRRNSGLLGSSAC